MAQRTGLIYHPDFLKHLTGEGHPERPGRLTAIVECLEKNHFWNDLIHIDPVPASKEDIEAVHTRSYIDRVEALAAEGDSGVDMETPVSPDSYRAALLAAGAGMTAVDAVMGKKADNVFVLCRPPGHHATITHGMGFCLFNNIAVAARHAQGKHGLKRILIVDWDIHHGNGTQDIFYEDPDVFYFSTHLYPHYPGTGSASETGKGRGRGTTLNVPLPHGAGDKEVLTAFQDQLVPAARRFRPEFILVSAGFDAHHMDPLSGLAMTCPGFYSVTRIVRELAEELCQGRLVSLLEGGYHSIYLPWSALAHLDGLADLEAGHLYSTF